MAGSTAPKGAILTCDSQAKVDPALLDALCLAVRSELSKTYPKLRIDRAPKAEGSIGLTIASANTRRITAFLTQSNGANGAPYQGPALGMSVVDTHMNPVMMAEFARFLVEEAHLQ
ncbi:MAG: hypothetical protein ACRBBK_04020 [Paracoccaceae bacterium]